MATTTAWWSICSTATAIAFAASTSTIAAAIDSIGNDKGSEIWSDRSL